MAAAIASLVLSTLVVILLSFLLRVLVCLIWKPYAITQHFKKQGVDGPGYKFFKGSIEDIKAMKREASGLILDTRSHDVASRVIPHYIKWASQYGNVFLFWFGTNPRLLINDPEMAKHVLTNKFGFYPKLDPHPNILALLGKGLLLVQGSEWVRHRRIVNPAFTMDKLKMLTRKIADCVRVMLQGWEEQAAQAADKQKEVEVSTQFQELTADVISYTVFGSSSFAEGTKVFLAQKELQIMASANILNTDFPGSRLLPNKKNLCKWKLERRVNNTLMRIIQRRLDSKDSSYGHDLLGLMMEASQKQSGQRMNMHEIIDECKTFFFTGHETTSHLLTWTLFLLSTNRDWQEKLRDEVLRECGQQVPDADMLSNLKLVTMVLLETLRLYGPVVQLARKASQNMVLGNISIPKGTALIIPIIMIHRSKEIWGPDVDEFNPHRFKNGISKAASHPNALLAFGIGPRACIGQNFAMLEAKTVTAMLLQRFSFSLSPKYEHAPNDLLTVQPQHGLPIVFTPLHV